MVALQDATRSHLIVPRAHKVLDDVTTRSVTARVAEPFSRLHTTHDARRVMNAAETARPFRSLDVCRTQEQKNAQQTQAHIGIWQAAYLLWSTHNNGRNPNRPTTLRRHDHAREICTNHNAPNRTPHCKTILLLTVWKQATKSATAQTSQIVLHNQSG